MDTHISNPKSSLISTTLSPYFTFKVTVKLCQNCSHKVSTSSPGTSPRDRGQVKWYQVGNKTYFIPKINKFYVEKGYSLCKGLSTNNLSSLSSKTLLPLPVLNGP